MQQKRLDYLDMAKGIGIFLVTVSYTHLLGSVFQQDEPDVYYQNLAGDEDEKEIDEAVLKDWLDFCIGDAGQLEIPMVDLTEENIKALK